MSRNSLPACCVVHGASCRSRLSAPDAVVVVVIAVLACGLSVTGLETPSVLTVLGGAGLVAAGVLMVLRGAGDKLGRLVMRVAHATAAP